MNLDDVPPIMRLRVMRGAAEAAARLELGHIAIAWEEAAPDENRWTSWVTYNTIEKTFYNTVHVVVPKFEKLPQEEITWLMHHEAYHLRHPPINGTPGNAEEDAADRWATQSTGYASRYDQSRN